MQNLVYILFLWQTPWPKAWCVVEEFYFSFQVIVIVNGSQVREVKAGNWRQKMKQRPRKSAAYRLAPQSLLGLLYYTTQDNLPKGGITGSSHINHSSQKYPQRLV